MNKCTSLTQLLVLSMKCSAQPKKFLFRFLEIIGRIVELEQPLDLNRKATTSEIVSLLVDNICKYTRRPTGCGYFM